MKRFETLLVLTILATSGAGRAEAQGQRLLGSDTLRAALRFMQPDVDFMTGMIAHHAQAVTMARWAPTHGASPSVQTLCARIINAQGDEIVLMQNWLHDKQQPVPEPDPRGMHMAGM